MVNVELPGASIGFFITGTDTGVGKTLIACALLRALAARGLRVIGMKPVAAGAMEENRALVNEDVIALKAAANVRAPDELVNPFCFAPPIAPHIAAAQAGTRIERRRLSTAYRALTTLADCVVVEGAGGFRVPLGAHFDTADLAADLDLPVVLVVGMRLGCINHALLSASEIERFGLKLAGWVANHIDAGMACPDENVAALRARIRAPMLARVECTPHIAPADVANMLDVNALLAPGSRG